MFLMVKQTLHISIFISLGFSYVWATKHCQNLTWYRCPLNAHEAASGSLCHLIALSVPGFHILQLLFKTFSTFLSPLTPHWVSSSWKLKIMEIKCFSFLSLIQSYLNLYYTCPLDTLYPEDEVHVLLSKNNPFTSVLNAHPFSFCVYVYMSVCKCVYAYLSRCFSFWSCFPLEFSSPLCLVTWCWYLLYYFFLITSSSPFSSLPLLSWKSCSLPEFHSCGCIPFSFSFFHIFYSIIPELLLFWN